MTRGKVKKAERLALNEFDKWNNVAGIFNDDSGSYYEIQSVIKDAVHIGIQMAIFGSVKFEDGNLVKKEIKNG